MTFDFAETKGRLRRFYLRKRLAALQEESSLAEVWQARQEAEPGTPLPTGFPGRATLLATALYTTAEDIDGADARELRVNAGLDHDQATRVIAAAAGLL